MNITEFKAMKHFATGCLISFLSHTCFAQTSITPLQEGEYFTNGGYGQLVISKGGKGNTVFDIDSVNGEDGCTLNGEIHDGHGLASDKNVQGFCKVIFTKEKNGINVRPETPEICQSFCGHNGEFKGFYSKVKQGCGSKEIDSIRSDFKHFYDEKKYDLALSRLQPVLRNCQYTLDWQEEGKIRNDLAIVQYKNGLYSQCLTTLKPYVGDAKRDDGDITSDKPAWYANGYLKIIHSARTNISLCNKSISNN